jgi:hypothetical protein
VVAEIISATGSAESADKRCSEVQNFIVYLVTKSSGNKPFSYICIKSEIFDPTKQSVDIELFPDGIEKVSTIPTS